jgi:hypothetical protein
MEKRNNLVTFLSALIPGVGQIVLGLYKRGIQLFALWILIRPVLAIIGLGFIGGLIQLIIWCYAFFDTFDIAKRLDKGERVNDSAFIFEKYIDNDFNKGSKIGFNGHSINRNLWKICGWGLIVIGILAIINLTFNTNDLYSMIKSYISMYILPIILVGAGFFMLFRYKN